MSFSGKVALVVGAGREDGIAAATAMILADRGATIALADLADSSVDRIAAGLHGAGHSAHHVDMRDEASVRATVEAVVERHGRIDVAMIGSAVLRNEPFLDISLAEWNRVFAVNTAGTFIMAQTIAREMVAHGGSMVCVASNAGRVPRWNNATYGSSKAAVIHLVKCMALELAPYQIRVNALCPGSTATSMAIANKSEGDPALVANLVRGSLDEWRTGIPLGRLAEAQDQAAAAAFLLGADAKHITGQALCVDGGQTFF